MRTCNSVTATAVLFAMQLSGVGVASKPLSGKAKAVDTETEDIEARLRQLHS